MKNEIHPIKQSISVMGTLFGGWGYAVAFAAGYYPFRNFLGNLIRLTLFSALSIFGIRGLYLWLKRNGTKIFASL